MSSKQLGNIRVLRELFKHQVHADARSLDHWLSRQNPWISDDPLEVNLLLFFHIPVIMAYQGNRRFDPLIQVPSQDIKMPSRKNLPGGLSKGRKRQKRRKVSGGFTSSGAFLAGGYC